MKPQELEKEVESIERVEGSKQSAVFEAWRVIGIIIGSVVYAVGFNMFLAPLNLCAGGFMGLAQLIDIFIRDGLNLHLGSIELPGILYYLLNIPWMVVAYRSMRKRFVFKTVFAITSFSSLLTLLPIMSKPILEDTIANALVAGLMCGTGIGIVLRMGASDGGVDLLGMIIIQKKGRFSIGKINLLGNIILYLICLFVYDLPSVIYSLVYVVVSSFTIDKVHVQNINVLVHIVTQMNDPQKLEIEIMGQLERGITRWQGIGAYTGAKETILMIVVNKYEIRRLRAIVQEIDPKAFVLIEEGVDVVGNFLKKLT